MNTLEYKYTKESPFIYGSGNQMIIDGVETGWFLNEPGVVLSAEQDGIFPMFVGGCDTFGCCGTYIEVTRENYLIIWKRFFDGQCEGIADPEAAKASVAVNKEMKLVPPLAFDQAAYLAMAKDLEKDARKDPKRAVWFDEKMKAYKSGDLSEF